MLQSALDYVSWGFAVFPLSQNSKIPLKGTSGVKEATKDVNKIRTLWLATPHANVGVALGEASGVVAIDLDKGATAETLKMFPRTVTARTKGGWHLYYKYIPGLKNTQLVKEGFNATLRSTGYYVVGVGSFVEGHEYQWASDAGGELSPSECAFAELPAEFAKVKKTYGENTRHQMFVETATAMRAKGHQPSEVLAELHRRNHEDCNPPKENADKELQDIVQWAFGQVPVNPAQAAQQASSKNSNVKWDNTKGTVNAEHYLQPLGFDENYYYYTSSSNKQIVKLAASAHSKTGLLHLMPYEYWESNYGKYDEDGACKGVYWDNAASDMLQACREQGIFDPKKVRGLGCWREGEQLVVHLGDRLWIGGHELPLSSFRGSRNIYELRQQLPSPKAEVATSGELHKVVEACNCLAWSEEGQGLLFAGGLAILRICGALKWRPMLWLTGPSGSGKTTVMENVVKNIAGSHGVYVLGNSSEAGIRQRLKASAQPVVFDEAETDDKRSGLRMKAVLELVRQASSDTDAQIVKGTSDGKGMAFKVNSMFLMSSIQVNLTSEQDINRFTVLELKRNNPTPWKDVQHKLDAITEELGDKLFSYMLVNFDSLTANQELLEKIIAESTDMRTAQQYSILLAGYSMLNFGGQISEQQARELCEKVKIIKQVHDAKEDSEQEGECLTWLKSNTVNIEILGERREIMIGELVTKATGNTDYLDATHRLGIDIDDKYVYVSSNNPNLEQLYANTRWQGALWGKTLARLPNAIRSVRRQFRNARQRTTAIPISIFCDGNNA